MDEEKKEMVMMLIEECRQIHEANDDDMHHMLSGNVPETRSAKCTLACAMKQFKFVKQKSIFGYFKHFFNRI